MPFSKICGRKNVFLFGNLSGGNISWRQDGSHTNFPRSGICCTCIFRAANYTSFQVRLSFLVDQAARHGARHHNQRELFGAEYRASMYSVTALSPYGQIIHLATHNRRNSFDRKQSSNLVISLFLPIPTFLFLIYLYACQRPKKRDHLTAAPSSHG